MKPEMMEEMYIVGLHLISYLMATHLIIMKPVIGEDLYIALLNVKSKFIKVHW